MPYDSIIVELLAEMLAVELHAIRDDNGDCEIPCQHVSRERLETITSVMYEAITVTEIERFGKKLIGDDDEG